MMSDVTLRSYSELAKIVDFKDRFNYLRMDGEIGLATFGFDRYLNQRFYKSKEWLWVRALVIVRDLGCDLGIDGLEITGTIMVHHINSVSIDDIKNRNSVLLDPEYLITTQLNTHNAIHFGDESLITTTPIERSPDDTKLW